MSTYYPNVNDTIVMELRARGDRLSVRAALALDKKDSLYAVKLREIDNLIRSHDDEVAKKDREIERLHVELATLAKTGVRT